MKDYGVYVDEVTRSVKETVQDSKTQPILFVGSGLSQRYFGGPNWKSLLEKMAERCPHFEQDVDYYIQRDFSMPEIGTELAKSYSDWAWNDGSERYPEEYFDSDGYDFDIFLKHEISEFFESITPSEPSPTTEKFYHQEIDLIKQVQPHAVITTNYDQFLENIFPDYKPIIRDEVFGSDYESVGEIIKIHGCVSEPDTLVLTTEDYREFEEKKKYISAKLLTHFAEHPVLITGYSVEDKNVRRILADIGEILAPNGGIVDNIFFLKYSETIDSMDTFRRQQRIDTLEEDFIEVNRIIAEDFDWVFNSFATGGEIEGVNLKLLRSVLANTYDIVREKAPKREIEIDYQNLRQAANSEDALGTLFGVTTLDEAPDLNFIYRHRLTEVADELGYDQWQYANQLIEQIQEETGYNIKATDNKYHIDIAINTDDHKGRYSDEAVELLRKVRDGEEYEMEIEDSESTT